MAIAHLTSPLIMYTIIIAVMVVAIIIILIAAVSLYTTNIKFFMIFVPWDFIECLKSVQIQLLNRIATVKDDGTVEFEVPGDIGPHDLDAASQDVHTEVACDETLDAAELQYIPPLQIVMLIVGTRGDVQPFVAIGKRLQVRSISSHSKFSLFFFLEFSFEVMCSSSNICNSRCELM